MFKPKFRFTHDEVRIIVMALVEFKNHPFYVIDNEEMNELVNSITDSGVLVPIIVRPVDDNYEIIVERKDDDKSYNNQDESKR